MVSGIMIFVLVVPISAAQSAIRAGTVCTKLKQTSNVEGYIVRCIKSGQKLVWSKGAKVVTPTPTPTFAPWSTSITRDSLIAAGQKNFAGWFNQHQSDAAVSGVRIFTDPALSGMNLDWIKSVSELTAKTFSYTRAPMYNVVLGASDSWVTNITSQNGIIIENSNGFACGMPSPSACSDAINTYYFIGQNIIYELGKAPLNQYVAPPHEYFHLVQGALMRPSHRPGDLFVPQWLIEGSANFIGYSFLDKAGVGTYATGRQLELDWFSDQLKRLPYSPLRNVTRNFHSNYPTFNITSTDQPYGIGMVATEYIVASAGMESLLNIFRNIGQGQDFPTAFRNAAGLDLSDFYQKFEAIRDVAGVVHGS